VNIAGFAAANILKGDVEQVVWSELPGFDRKKEVLIDVRNPGELATEGTMPRSIHIPLPQLRKRMGELDKSKRYLSMCAAGLRSYIGYRMLTQNGFRVRNVAGGFRLLKGVGRKVGAKVKGSSRG